VGSWGVTARQSDRGLDYLDLIVSRCLKPINFKNFDVNAILEMLRNHIIGVIRKEEEPYMENKADVWEYIACNVPKSYNYVVLLVAEILVEYFQKGEVMFHDYDTDKKMKITEFIFTDSDLYELLKELEEMLNPKHEMSTSWFEPETLNEWQSHVNMLCDCLKRGFGSNG